MSEVKIDAAEAHSEGYKFRREQVAQVFARDLILECPVEGEKRFKAQKLAIRLAYELADEFLKQGKNWEDR